MLRKAWLSEALLIRAIRFVHICLFARWYITGAMPKLRNWEKLRDCDEAGIPALLAQHSVSHKESGFYRCKHYRKFPECKFALRVSKTLLQAEHEVHTSGQHNHKTCSSVREFSANVTQQVENLVRDGFQPKKVREKLRESDCALGMIQVNFAVFFVVSVI